MGTSRPVASTDHHHRNVTDLAGQISFGPPKTKAAVRTVGLPAFVADELAQIASQPLDRDALVFQSAEGCAVRPGLLRRRYWTPVVEAAGLAPLRMHDLRHTAISLWIAVGANPKQIAVRAGHTSVSVVLDRYGHLFPQHEDALLQALELPAVISGVEVKPQPETTPPNQ